jgi:hypothetical protein
MVSDTLAQTTRAAHDWGLASFLGGTMYGKFAMNPAVRAIDSKADRGKVTNSAWNGYNVINGVSLAAVGLGWGAARLTEARPDRLSGRERSMARAKDGFVASTLLTGIASGIQGARLAKQAPDGAVPMDSGTTPAQETPKTAATIQRTLGVLGNLSILSGVGVVVTNALLAQAGHSRPPVRRALLRRTRR